MIKPIAFSILALLNWSFYSVLSRFLSEIPDTGIVPFLVTLLGFVTAATLLYEGFRGLREDNTRNRSGLRSTDKGE